ncbi:MAG: DEAD/DEAH box helicase [Candidatus Woesearchaeota archaeon]|jgi:helicase|nr:DEAD/DEAH box helicase [Candidatus Woesearchaeota archaeon]
MKEDVLKKIPEEIFKILEKRKLLDLRPCQEKSIKKGLFENNHNQIICTPTGSGKTLVAELAMLDVILNKKKRVVYIVPLKALASEKFKEFTEEYSEFFRIRLSIGELQTEKYNYDYDLLIVTAEKLDSLIRHDKTILEGLGLVIADEIHLLNDERRGPTLEVLLSIFKSKYPRIRLIGLSATIGNSKEIANWLRADLVEDDWRPVELQHYVLSGDELLRYK